MAAVEAYQSNPEPRERIYRSYLLRCWQEAGAGADSEPSWRFTLVQFNSQQRRQAFASLDELVGYLLQELG